MEFLEISGRCPRKDSVARTIRISGKSFDKISQIAEKMTYLLIMLLIKL